MEHAQIHLCFPQLPNHPSTHHPSIYLPAIYLSNSPPIHTHSAAYPSIHLLILSSIYTYTPTITHSSIHPSACSLVCLPLPSSTYPLSNHLPTHPPIPPYNYRSIRPATLFTRPKDHVAKQGIPLLPILVLRSN